MDEYEHIERRLMAAENLTTQRLLESVVTELQGKVMIYDAEEDEELRNIIIPKIKKFIAGLLKMMIR